VTALIGGTCNISAVLSPATVSAASITVPAAPVTLTTLTTSPGVSVSSNPFQYSLLGNYSDGSIKAVTGAVWSSSNSQIASVDSAGNVSPTGVIGSSIITVTAGGLSTTTILIVPPKVPPALINYAWPYFFPANAIAGTYTVVINADGTETVSGPQ
jgi:hypothetical protein